MATKVKVSAPIKLRRNSSKVKIRKAWIEALRSGDYKQTEGTLHEATKKKEGFCCLGVLCDLAVKAGVVDVESEEYKDTAIYSYDKKSSVLPHSVKDWAGLSTTAGDFKKALKVNGKFYDNLADLNDGGKKFTTIAKIIEATPEGLFA